MAQSLGKTIFVHLTIMSYPKVLCAASISPMIALRLLYGREFFRTCCKYYENQCIYHFSTCSKPEKLCWEGSSHSILMRNLESSLKDHQVVEAWEAFNDFKSLYGFPNNSLMSRLISELSYSSDLHWLQRACDLVFSLRREKPDLLRPDLLTKLSLSLARAQMPIPSSKILRLMLEKDCLPNANVIGLVVMHMVKTEIGTNLVSNILAEICDYCLGVSAKNSTSAKLVKPDTMIFNLVLDACVRFGSFIKGQQFIELMAQVGAIADAHTIVIIAQIHEMNGQRDELKKFKNHIDQVSAPLLCHYRQFYDSLLSLHFKFNDIDAALELILDICGYRESHSLKKDGRDPQKPCLVQIGSHNLRTGLRIQISPELLKRDSVLCVGRKKERKKELIQYRNWKLVPSNRSLAKLIIQYKKGGRINELSGILGSIQKKLGSLDEYRLCSDVFEAFIQLGWLEAAHDILDDMELAGVLLGPTSYMSLLTAYYRENLLREANAFLSQIKKADLLISMPSESTLSSKVATSNEKSDLAESLLREMREEEREVTSLVYDLNSSIYFFFKAKMIGDALKTYRRMQAMDIKPTVLTFAITIHGYSSLEMYREITILWGDIKRNMENGNLVVNRDLYEILLLTFLRGGYFERVMEVIDYMKNHDMFMDKWMYRSEFLKLHKDLYRSLKASNTKTEVQNKRLELVRAFRKWVGID